MTKIYWVAQEVRGRIDQEETGKFSIHEYDLGDYPRREAEARRLGDLISIPGAGRFLRLECGAFGSAAEATKALGAAPAYEGYRSIHNA